MFDIHLTEIMEKTRAYKSTTLKSKQKVMIETQFSVYGIYYCVIYLILLNF